MVKNTILASAVWVLMLTFFFAATVCQSQTSYYVDPSYTGGGSTGSATKPWTSLSSGWSSINTALASGPVTVYFSATGSSTSQINLPSQTNISHHLTLDGISYIDPTPSSPPASWTANVVPGPSNYQAAAKFTVTASNVLASNITGSGPGSNDAPCKTVNMTIQGFKLVATDGGYGSLSYLGGYTLQYNEGYTLKSATYGPGMLIGTGNQGICGSGNADNVSILYNFFHDSYGECLYVGASSSNPPDNPNLRDWSTGDNYLIQGNRIESCATQGGQGDGTDVKDGHANLRVINNQYRTSKRCQLASGCNNANGGNDGQGPLFESGSLIDGNYIESPGHQCVPIYASWNNTHGRGNIVVRNNICVNAKSGSGSNNGFELWTATYPASQWTSVEFYNNTVYNAGGSCVGAQSGGVTGSASAQNNICSSTSGISLSAPTVAKNHNTYFNSGSCPSETGVVCADPQFISTATPYVDSNFGLQSSSPAVGTGADLATIFTDDYLLDTRSSPWDMGAFASSVVSGGAPQPPSGLAAAVN
jgi:hypothetical protein